MNIEELIRQAKSALESEIETVRGGDLVRTNWGH